MNASIQLYNALQHLSDGRVYPLIVPENAINTPPYIVYTPVSSVPVHTLDGITHNTRERMQVDIYHYDYDELIPLSVAVLDALDGLPMSEIESISYSVDDGLFRGSVDVLFNATSK